MNARYYNGVIGRFISQDPLEIVGLQGIDANKFAALISNPQNWNTYSYALNNPLVASDPSGLLTIMVPGTVLAGSAADRDLQWVSSDLYKSVANTFHEAPYLFGGYMGWNGSDNDHARGIAAGKLSEFINSYHFSEGEKLNIVGYSHGGNVVLEATHNLNHTIDNLVTYNTPVRDDYTPDVSKIGNYVQLFNSNDKVQNHAGGEFSVTGILGFVLNGPLGFKGGNVLGWGEFGRAGRRSSYADHIFDFAGKADNSGPLNAHNMPLNGDSSRFIWNDVVKHLLK
jgi:RHS repeat-associated protein